VSGQAIALDQKDRHAASIRGEGVALILGISAARMLFYESAPFANTEPRGWVAGEDRRTVGRRGRLSGEVNGLDRESWLCH
jgi:hypothetical protein